MRSNSFKCQSVTFSLVTISREDRLLDAKGRGKNGECTCPRHILVKSNLARRETFPLRGIDDRVGTQHHWSSL